MITLNVPSPLSVNKTRRIDWREHAKTKEWLRQADAQFLLQKQALAGQAITGPFELTLTLRDGSRKDLDNCCKIAIDAVRRYRLVTDDDPAHMRRLVVEFGDVEGCRVTIRSMEG